jgi:hypothetical protein
MELHFFLSFCLLFQKIIHNFAVRIKKERRRIMARPIKETPILKGIDAFNFEMRRLEVEHMSKEQRAENSRKVREDYEAFRKRVEICL